MCLQWWAKASFQHQVIVTTIPSCICVFGRWFNCLRWWPSRPSPSSYPDSMSYRRRRTNKCRQGMWAEHLVLTGFLSCCNSQGKWVWNYDLTACVSLYVKTTNKAACSAGTYWVICSSKPGCTLDCWWRSGALIGFILTLEVRTDRSMFMIIRAYLLTRKGRKSSNSCIGCYYVLVDNWFNTT